jgi:hypothetical protein
VNDAAHPISPVLAIIQEKVNNPSPDDPFEPEIAAVRGFGLLLLPGLSVDAVAEERQGQVPGYCKRAH